MNIWTYKTNDEYLLEECIRLLVISMPEEASTKKPVLLHSLRVWEMLLHYWYDNDVVIAWYLHDLLEDSDIDQDLIVQSFWVSVLDYIQASSKDLSIPKEDRLNDMIQRCVDWWDDAIVVKAADIYDNLKFYTIKNADSEIQRCLYQCSLLFNLIDKTIMGRNRILKDLYSTYLSYGK